MPHAAVPEHGLRWKRRTRTRSDRPRVAQPPPRLRFSQPSHIAFRRRPSTPPMAANPSPHRFHSEVFPPIPFAALANPVAPANPFVASASRNQGGRLRAELSRAENRISIRAQHVSPTRYQIVTRRPPDDVEDPRAAIEVLREWIQNTLPRLAQKQTNKIKTNIYSSVRAFRRRGDMS